jgi:hypothetical protein
MTHVVQSACISWLTQYSYAIQNRFATHVDKRCSIPALVCTRLSQQCWSRFGYCGTWQCVFLKRRLQLCTYNLHHHHRSIWKKIVSTELVFDTPSLSCCMGDSHRVKAWPVYTKTQRSIGMPQTTPPTCKRPKPMISSTGQLLSR